MFFFLNGFRDIYPGIPFQNCEIFQNYEMLFHIIKPTYYCRLSHFDIFIIFTCFLDMFLVKVYYVCHDIIC